MVEARQQDYTMEAHLYVSTWVTLDGRVRHELLADGHYTERNGQSDTLSQGRYTIEDDHITYVDDTGVVSEGLFINGVLHRNGMYLYVDEYISYY